MLTVYYAKDTPIQGTYHTQTWPTHILRTGCSRASMENKDKGIARMSINISTISTAVDMAIYTSIKDLQMET